VEIAKTYVSATPEQFGLDRLANFGDTRSELNTDMMSGLVAWTSGKPAAKGLSRKQKSALVISVFGGWLFYLSMLKQDTAVDQVRDTLLHEWATRWASILDTA